MAEGEGRAPAQQQQPEHGDSSCAGLPLDFTTKDIDDGLLRGVAFHELVAGCGKHWVANSQSSEVGESWFHTTKVIRNTYFVSHSWKSSRWLKWLSLLAIANTRLALAGGTLACVFARIFCHFQATPSIAIQAQVGDAVWVVSALRLPPRAAYAMGCALFFQGHRFRQVAESWGWLRPRTAFLDKLVIHQDDPAMRQRGIELLGAFLKSSDVFLVLWSEHYLTRLWCSYEVAVFAFLQSEGHQGALVVWPLPFTAAMAALVMVAMFGYLAQELLYCSPLPGVMHAYLGGFAMPVAMLIIIAPSFTIVVGAIAQTLRDVEVLERQVAAYSLSDSECFYEDDRSIVEASVAAWFATNGCDKDAAIAKFDEFLRSQFAAFLGESFSRWARPPCGAALCIAVLLSWSDTLAVVRPWNMAWRTYAVLIANCAVQDICGTMLGFAFQYRAIVLIQRCFRSPTYAAVPPQDQPGASQGAASGYVVFGLQVFASTFVVAFFQTLALAPVSLPLPANIVVSSGLVAWTMYEFK